MGLLGGALWYSAMAGGYPFFPYPYAPYFGFGSPFYAYGGYPFYGFGYPYSGFGFGYPFYAYYMNPYASFWYPPPIYSYASYWEPEYVYSYTYRPRRIARRTSTCAICICPTVASVPSVPVTYSYPQVALW